MRSETAAGSSVVVVTVPPVAAAACAIQKVGAPKRVARACSAARPPKRLPPAAQSPGAHSSGRCERCSNTMTLRLTRNLAAAQSAYAEGNPLALIQAHLGSSKDDEPTIYEPAHKSQLMHDHMKRYGKAVIYGGSFSLLIMSVLLASVFGSDLSNGVYVGVGSICLLSGSLFVGYSDYMNEDYELELLKWERKREAWEYDNFLEGEEKEMIELYETKGMRRDDAEKVIRCMSKYKDFFVDLMMVQELGLLAPIWTPLQHGLGVFFSFIICGLVPLAPVLAYTWMLHGKNEPLSTTMFLIAFFLLGACIFALGCLKSYFVEGEAWWKPGLLELSNLGLATATSYLLSGQVKQYLLT